MKKTLAILVLLLTITLLTSQELFARYEPVLCSCPDALELLRGSLMFERNGRFDAIRKDLNLVDVEYTHFGCYRANINACQRETCRGTLTFSVGDSPKLHTLEFEAACENGAVYTPFPPPLF